MVEEITHERDTSSLISFIRSYDAVDPETLLTVSGH